MRKSQRRLRNSHLQLPQDLQAKGKLPQLESPQTCDQGWQLLILLMMVSLPSVMATAATAAGSHGQWWRSYSGAYSLSLHLDAPLELYAPFLRWSKAHCVFASWEEACLAEERCKDVEIHFMLGRLYLGKHHLGAWRPLAQLFEWDEEAVGRSRLDLQQLKSRSQRRVHR